MFIVGGLQKTTLLDFPKKIAAIVFTQGCNFRCGYCHNPELLSFSENNSEQKNSLTEEDVLNFLQKRKGKLDGIVITGGEPTLQSGLYDFIKKVKSLNFLVKLDTNGTNSEILKKLIDEKFLDYIAMDIKSPIEKYQKITNVNVKTENILKSIELIKNSGIDYEFRTTVLKSQLKLEDFEEIGKMINGATCYYLQKFVPSKIYDEKLLTEQNYTDIEFNQICEILKKYVNVVEIR